MELTSSSKSSSPESFSRLRRSSSVSGLACRSSSGYFVSTSAPPHAVGPACRAPHACHAPPWRSARRGGRTQPNRATWCRSAHCSGECARHDRRCCRCQAHREECLARRRGPHHWGRGLKADLAADLLILIFRPGPAPFYAHLRPAPAGLSAAPRPPGSGAHTSALRCLSTRRHRTGGILWLRWQSSRYTFTQDRRESPLLLGVG